MEVQLNGYVEYHATDRERAQNGPGMRAAIRRLQNIAHVWRQFDNYSGDAEIVETIATQLQSDLIGGWYTREA